MLPHTTCELKILHGRGYNYTYTHTHICITPYIFSNFHKHFEYKYQNIQKFFIPEHLLRSYYDFRQFPKISFVSGYDGIWLGSNVIYTTTTRVTGHTLEYFRITKNTPFNVLKVFRWHYCIFYPAMIYRKPPVGRTPRIRKYVSR